MMTDCMNRNPEAHSASGVTDFARASRLRTFSVLCCAVHDSPSGEQVVNLCSLSSRLALLKWYSLKWRTSTAIAYSACCWPLVLRCHEPERFRAPSRPPHLAARIWDENAQLVSLSDSAYAAGSCKAMWNLQLGHFCVDRKLAVEDLPSMSHSLIISHL